MYETPLARSRIHFSVHSTIRGIKKDARRPGLEDDHVCRKSHSKVQGGQKKSISLEAGPASTAGEVCLSVDDR